CHAPQSLLSASLFFLFEAPATTEIYTLSLHDALPISSRRGPWPAAIARTSTKAGGPWPCGACRRTCASNGRRGSPTRFARIWSRDRKSTRLNSSHVEISYAVFCLKKKKKKQRTSFTGR